jgi:tRNA1(Val) A37 N6-methylase TrmN6
VLNIEASAAQFAVAGLPPDSVDVVMMNPPFNDAARHRASPDPHRQIAHQATATTLENWVHAARRVLKSGGVLTLIWRAEALAEVLMVLQRGFGSLAVLPVHGVADGPAIRILARAIKGGRAPLQLYPGIALTEAGGARNETVDAVLTGRQVLRLAER